MTARRRRSIGMLAAAGAVAALVLAVRVVAPRFARRPDILLVTLDTTRTDALGCYGGPRASTPVLDGLASEGARFEHAIVSTPYTGASHASMLTGLFPPRHGLRDFLNEILPETVPTLAERLRAAGYDTAAFVSSYVLDRRYGLARGFDVYASEFWQEGEAPEGHHLQRRADATVADVSRWLEQRRGDRPFFVWLHLFDAHAPYDPPGVAPGPEPLDAWQRLDRIQRLYYGEVTYMDAQLGVLFDRLRASGMYDRLVVLVIADHGELLGDHHALGHSRWLYDTTIRVPLLLRLPGRVPAGVVEPQVRSVDVFPTLLEAARLAVPAGIDGRSLIPLARGRDEPPRPAYAETFYEFLPRRAAAGEELVSLRLEGWKLVTRPGREELYDLGADPRERENVAAAHPERVAALRTALARLAAEGPAAAPQRLQLPPEEQAEHERRMRALGYVQ